MRTKELLKSIHKPFIINFRVNAGRIPKAHWIEDTGVGGRGLVRECCHFFDFFNSIIESDVESVDAKTVPIDNKTAVVRDNLVTSIRWVDGSITTLTYTSLGPPDFPKEYIEVNAKGFTVIIDDFRKFACMDSER